MTGARARAREALTEDIKALARRQLAEGGASELSLRQIARELGMVSSAVYRYFASRDELLTALIVESYEAVGAVAEAAAKDRRGGFTGRWLRVATAIRAWATANPHDYALIYGTPVPGYRAPQDTVPAAIRISAVALGLVSDAVAAGEVDDSAAATVSIPRAVRRDLATIREEIATGVSDDVLSRGLLAWTMMFGTISFELFGHLHGAITDYDAFFEVQVRRAADVVLRG